MDATSAGVSSPGGEKEMPGQDMEEFRFKRPA